MERQAKGTRYSKIQGLYFSNDTAWLTKSRWWLKTPRNEENVSAYCVYEDGDARVASIAYIAGVRPACWINL